MLEQARDTAVVLTLERRRGSAGVVGVAWEASGELDRDDIRPVSGLVRSAGPEMCSNRASEALKL